MGRKKESKQVFSRSLFMWPFLEMKLPSLGLSLDFYLIFLLIQISSFFSSWIYSAAFGHSSPGSFLFCLLAETWYFFHQLSVNICLKFPIEPLIVMVVGQSLLCTSESPLQCVRHSVSSLLNFGMSFHYVCAWAHDMPSSAKWKCIILLPNISIQ